MAKHRFIFLICIWITACGQSTISTPTATPPVDETPSPASTLPITFGPYLTPTRNIAPMIPPEIATDQAESTVEAHMATVQVAETATAWAENRSRGTNTPRPTPTSTPTFIPAIEGVNFDVDLPYLQDGGALPPGALGRIGIGNIGYVSQVNDQANILIETSTGLYAYQRDTFERVWRRYLTWNPWGATTSPNSARIVTHSGWEAAPVMYDTEDGNRVAVLDGWYWPYWSPDDTKVAVEERPPWNFLEFDSFTARINLYNGFNGEHLRTLEVELPGFYGSVFPDIIWSPDSTYIAACPDTCSNIYIWNALNAELLHTIPADTVANSGETPHFSEFGFSPDGKYLVASNNSYVLIFDLNSGDLVLNEEGRFSNIEFFGEYLLFTHKDGLTILDLSTLDEVNTVPDMFVSNIMVSPEGDRLAVGSGGNIVVRALPSFEMQYRIPLSVNYVYWSPGGEWVIGYNYNNDAYIFIDADSGEPRFPPLVPSGGLQFLDENTVIVVDGLNVFQLDLTTGEIINGVQFGIDIQQLGWSPEGQLLLLDSEDKLWAWKENTGEVSQLQADIPLTDTLKAIDLFSWQEDHKVEAESPDGRFLATVTGDAACGDGPFGGGCAVWSSEFILIDQETEESIITFTNSGTGITAFDWSSDGSMLAIGKGGGGRGSISNFEIIIIDPETGDELFQFEGHLNDVNKLIFSPDGTRLASASSDGSVIIWNTAR